MEIKKIVILALAIALIVFLRTEWRKTPSDVSQKDTFIVGTAAGYAPFVSINEKGEYEGFDIDVVNALAQAMGKKLVIKDLGSMASLFTALDQGMVDALIWGLSITKERLQKCAMVHYHGSSTMSYPLMFWKAIPQGITSLNDMRGMTVCVEPASSQEGVIKEYPDIMIVPTEKVDDAFLALSYGKVDAALVESAIAKKFKALHPEIQILDIPIPDTYYENGCGIVVRKTQAGLCLMDDIAYAVLKLKADGVIAQLEQKWGIAE